jgi:hypothetical protein
MHHLIYDHQKDWKKSLMYGPIFEGYAKQTRGLMSIATNATSTAMRWRGDHAGRESRATLSV